MIKDNLWSKNFEISNHPSFQLIASMIDLGLGYSDISLFGEEQPVILSKYFIHYLGNNMTGGYFKENDLRKLSDMTTKLIYESPEKVFKNHREAYDLNDQYFDCSKKCLSTNLEKLNDEELAKIYSELNILQEKSHIHALNTTWFVDSYGATLTNSLLDKTKEIVSFAKSKLNSAEVFTTLTTSAKNSLAIKEDLESLLIVEKILKDKKVKEIFENLKDYNEIPFEIPKSLKKDMIDHKDKWCWIPFGYFGPTYDMDYYLSIWAGLVRENADVKTLINGIKNRPKEIDKKRKDLFKELKVSSKMQKVYDVSADITFLKGYRKDTIYLGHYAIDYLFKEIAKRSKVKFEDIHWLTCIEIMDLLNGDIKFDYEEISRRKKSVVFYREGNKTSLLSGKDAEDFFNSQEIREEENPNLNAESFNGTCACSGYAKGIVKIINGPEDMSKMKKGDIMVSHTTFPSLVPAMKKAAAIVTEDGGITCHAAIVARELGTPCITGIKVATSVFHDGDEVEVDADEGVVKIVGSVDLDKYSKYKWDIVARDFHSHFIRNHLWTTSLFKQALEFKTPRAVLGISSKKEDISYIGDLKTWAATHEGIRKIIEKDDSFVEKNIDYTNKLGEEFNNWSEKNIFKKDLSKLKPVKLIELLREFVEKQAELYSYGLIVPLLDFHDFSYVEGNLKKYLNEKLDEEDYKKYFDSFTRPIYNSFAQDQEEDLLKLMEEFYSSEWVEDVQFKTLDELKKIYPKFYKKLEKHTEKHCWVYYVYGGPAFDNNNFLDFIKNYLEKNVNPKDKLKELSDKKKDNDKVKKEFIKKYKPDEFNERILNLVGKIVWAKPRRKDYQSKSYYHLEKFFKEVAHRLSLTLLQSRSIPIDMLEKALDKGEIDVKVVDEIFNCHVCVPNENGGVDTLYGKDAEEFNKRYLEMDENKTDLVDEIRGQTACPGKAKGIVKVINKPEDMDKMNSGDILVSNATTPSVVPAMKKAAAIVTDEGGLTCHASIVSRELGITCVIGTKNASKILKDGDLVEVDADEGVVRVLESGTEEENKDYIFHATVSGFNVLMLDLIFDIKTYGEVDYRLLYENDISLFYLTKKGFKECYELSKKLLDDDFTAKLIKDSEDMNKFLKKYKLSKLTEKSVLGEWKKYVKYADEFMRLYRFYEQPFQQALEESILNEISEEELLEYFIDKNKKIDDSEVSNDVKKAFKKLIELGEMKLKLHENSEKFYTEYFEKFIEFVAEKNNASIEIISCLREDEFLDALNGKKIDVKLCKKRLGGCVFVKKDNKWELDVGEDFVNLKNEIIGTNNKDIEGMIAYPGKVKGKVALHMSWTDTRDIDDGDILVTGMTNPQMIPFIKKAGAIVTDEGGITCHAAIISREMKKPCIIGTKVATQMLREGDLVEVDADNGIVRVLERAG